MGNVGFGQSSKPPCRLADVSAEIVELASKLNVCFVHVLHSFNDAMDLLTKVSGGHLFPSLCLLGFCFMLIWLLLFSFLLDGFSCSFSIFASYASCY